MAGVAGSCGVVVQSQGRLHTAGQEWLDPVVKDALPGEAAHCCRQEWLDPVRNW